MQDALAVFVLVVEVDATVFFLFAEAFQRLLVADVGLDGLAVGAGEAFHVVTGAEGGGVFHAFDDGGEGVGVVVEGDAAEAAFLGVVGQLALDVGQGFGGGFEGGRRRVFRFWGRAGRRR